MNARSATLLIVFLILATAAASLCLYPWLPAQLPIHWDWRGRPDGWADKSFAAYLMPDILAGLLVMMHLLPRLSPKPLVIEPFRATYFYIFAVLAGLMAHIHGMTLLCGLAPEKDFSRLFLSGLFLSFGLLGNVLGKVRRNLWMGIRTPWTLADDGVWIATHRLAARLLVIAGIVDTILLWLGVSPAICLILLGAALLVPVGASYEFYRQRERSSGE